MGRKRWAERRKRPPGLAPIEEVLPAVRIRCGYVYGDDSVCMAPASTVHALSHEIETLGEAATNPHRIDWHRTPPMMLAATTALAVGMGQAIKGAVEAERSEAARQLAEGTAKAPAGSGAPAGEMKPSLYRELTGRPYPRGLATEHGNYPAPTYEALKAAAADRAQFTPEQAQEILSAALGTRPHLAARVIDRLGPVLAGELARAVDGAVNGRINRYLAEERATLDRLYADQLAKLQADQERRGRDVNAERWTTPSRLS